MKLYLSLKKNKNWAVLLVISVFVFLFYRFFLSTHLFVAHDWPLLFMDSRNFSPFWAISWDYMGAGGVGGPAFKTLWIDLYANFVYAVSNTINLPWWLSQRIFWILPFISISLFSSYKFSGLFIKNQLFRVLSIVIFSFNTYILMILGGGQFGVAFAYGLSPLVLFFLFRLFKETNINNLILSSFFTGLIIALDPRISILVFGVAAFWYLFAVSDFTFRKIKYIILILLIAGLLNSYWIFPILVAFLNNSLSQSVSSYFSLEGVNFLSFAALENSISLLHPNWPENIFGKVYFFRPEFLILPILAFSALFKPKKEILFFASLALIGIFLAKGTNDPFGQIYSLLYQYIPGFSIFRDSTKFYLLIALSFSVLIPYSIGNIAELVKSKIPASPAGRKNQKSKIQSKYQIFNFSYVFLIFTILYLIFLLRPAWSGELTGVFKPKKIPEEYVRLNTNLYYSSQSSDSKFSRSLWVPRRQKYGYFDPSIPAADSEVLFKGRDISRVTEEELHSLSIRYIIVPSDPDVEIFLKDRKYDNNLREKTIKSVEKLPGLDGGFDSRQIKVYQTYSQSERFWNPQSPDLERAFLIFWSFVNPSEYSVRVESAEKGDLVVFSEGFDRNWVAKGSDFEIKSTEFENRLNSFILSKDGSYSFKVFYQPQRWVNIGLIISILTLSGLIIWKIMIYFRNDRSTGKN